jgi:hypothetical protein
MQVNTGKSTPRAAGWHPGPAGHELRGKILAYHYLRLLDDALADAHAAKAADVKAGSTEEASKLVAAAEKESSGPLPPPLHCDPLICLEPTQCALTYEPRAAGWGLQEVLVTAPEEARTAVPSLKTQDSGKWHVQLYAPDQEAVALGKEFGGNYLDLKYVLQGNKDAGPLTLRLQTTKAQRLYFCQPPGVWGRTPDEQASLDAATKVTVDGAAVKLLPLDDPFYGAHKLEAKVCFATNTAVKEGKHEVVVTPTDAEGKYVTLSAVVWY